MTKDCAYCTMCKTINRRGRGMGMEKRREGIRGENNERESRLNETRAIVRVHFFFFHYNFQPVFLFEKREYGFLTLAWAAFVVVPPCELVSRISFCLSVCKEKLARGTNGDTRGIKRKRTGEKLLRPARCINVSYSSPLPESSWRVTNFYSRYILSSFAR